MAQVPIIAARGNGATNSSYPTLGDSVHVRAAPDAIIFGVARCSSRHRHSARVPWNEPSLLIN